MSQPDVTYPLIHSHMPDPVAKALVETLYNQGFRIQEALAIPLPGGKLEADLGRRFLDLDARTLRVEFQRERDNSVPVPLKTGYSMATVKLFEPTVTALREALTWRRELDLKPATSSRLGMGLAARSFVFPYFKQELQGLMKIHRELAPLEFRRREVGLWGGDAWHVYRHSFATDLARQGIPKEEIHDLLRHQDMKTTDAYLRALLADVRGSEAVEQAIQRRKQRQQQAVEERSGKGLQLVKKRGDR